MVWHGKVLYGVVLYCMVWYGMVWCGMVWSGMVWYGAVCHGVVWCVVVWYGVCAARATTTCAALAWAVLVYACYRRMVLHFAVLLRLADANMPHSPSPTSCPLLSYDLLAGGRQALPQGIAATPLPPLVPIAMDKLRTQGNTRSLKSN